MTGPRVQVPEIEREQIRPQAVPIDTYAPEGEHALSKLAEGLASVAPAGRDLANLLQKRQNDADYAEGQASVQELRDEAKGYQDAIKKGLIDENESPWFRRGAEEQFGRLAADSFGSQVSHAAMVELADSTNPEDFDGFAAKIRSDFFEQLGDEGQGAAFAAGFNPRADAHLANARQQFNAQANTRAVQEVAEQTYQEHLNTIQQGLDSNLDMGTIAEGLNLTTERNFAVGMSGGKLNEVVIQAVVDAAEKMENANLLDLLEDVRGGSGTLENHSMAQRLVGPARSRIYAKQQSNLRWEQSQADRLKRDNANEIIGNVVTAVLESDNPFTVDIQGAQALLVENGSPELAASLGSFVQGIANSTTPDDPQTVNGLVTDVYMITDQADPNYVDIGRLFSMGLNTRDIEQVKRHMTTRDDTGGGSQAQQYARSQLSRNLTSIRRSFGSELPGNMFKQTYEDAALAGAYELTERFTQLMIEQPEIGATDLNRWFADQVTEIVTRRREEVGMMRFGGDTSSPQIGSRAWGNQRMLEQDQFNSYKQAFEAAGDSFAALPEEMVIALMELGVDTPENAKAFFIAQARFHPHN